jgi:peptidoglycan/xylan/chitin deacetylase (PgdA/CDA1 family)
VNQAAWLLLPPAVWAGYAWGSHVLTLGSAWHGPRLSGKVALTFDDGPDAAYTPRVLDVLAEHAVKASFFLIGERAAREPAVARRIADEGHDLGNHTWSHRSLWLSGPRETMRQVEQGHAAIAQVAGPPPRFFRPPWGMTNLALFPLLRKLRTPCVFWTVQTEGRHPAPPGLQIERVRRRARSGAILDLHDADGVPGAGARLLEALPGMIAAIRSRGLFLVPLRDLL